jgi:hypothetical protein
MSNAHGLEELSFPDFSVTKMRIDHIGRCAIFAMTGAWSVESPLGVGELALYDWESLRQRRYEAAKESWVDIPIGQEEPLKDICEFLVDSDQIVARGFGASSGEWIELIAKKARGEYRT